MLVALAEMGDKTQLLALTLASRYRRPWTVLAGVLVATLANRALAASVGEGVARAVAPRVLAVGVAMGFFVFRVWTLIPDRPAEPGTRERGAVTVGATLGMLAANGLAVFGGVALAARLPLPYLRWSAATLFGLFGALALASAFRGA